MSQSGFCQPYNPDAYPSAPWPDAGPSTYTPKTKGYGEPPQLTSLTYLVDYKPYRRWKADIK